MKPPRYILRENVVLKLIHTRLPARFLEIGYGSGEMLLTLARLGYTGDGYDVSAGAHCLAEQLLRRNGIAGINLVDHIETGTNYDLILFFEVIGYLADPVAQLSRYGEHLSPHGEMIFSFTNSRNQGYAEQVTGQMKCFSREEIQEILARAGLTIRCIWNYGFPLTNMMRPFLNGFHFVKNLFGTKDDSTQRMRESGMGHRHFFMKLVGLAVNPVTIYPVILLQRLFRHSDLGTGYVVVAGKK